ncbi:MULTISPECIES: DUF3883 domain-containing protein [unclassified Bradyrhizobium]|uniref:DUF3883 domain-containing protein n=1 Tax=unclassified Bradyrhizobium TaxID=2631580 RepID=UPI00230699E5|nr:MULTISPECIES: DUF3883 domain-containing protein [unclassified Bradyrhizobium]
MAHDSPARTLNKLTSPTAVKAAIAECDRLGREAFRRLYHFKPARAYALRYSGGVYDSKAIAAVAFGYQFGTEPLAWDECSGGKVKGNAAWALDRLGFHVTGVRHVGWWIEEAEAAVDAYLEMLALHQAGLPFKKKDYHSKLHSQGPSRTAKAYEWKLQNVSAVLQEMGREWLPGYAPAPGFQTLLRYVLEDRIGREFDSSEAEAIRTESASKPRLVRIDWALRDAENRELGKGGERYVFERERQTLKEANRADLAAKVKWEASEADGHGYDISSFDLDGKPIHIEVKTTAHGEATPFFVSSNELSTSSRLDESYRLYRVYNFPASPEITVYRGALEKCLVLNPTSYRAQRK